MLIAGISNKCAILLMLPKQSFCTEVFSKQKYKKKKNAWNLLYKVMWQMCIDSAELLFYEISYCHAFSSDVFTVMFSL